MNTLSGRVDRIEKSHQAQSALRIERALAGSLDMSELTDSELQVIAASTSPELQALFDRLTDEQLEMVTSIPLEQLPPDLRAACDEIIVADERIYGGAKQ